MKSFIAALLILVLLIGGITVINAFGVKRIDAYLELLPNEWEDFDTAAERLKTLREDINRRLWLLDACIHHEKINSLLAGIEVAEASALVEDEVEYALQVSELRRELLTLRREFKLTLPDFL